MKAILVKESIGVRLGLERIRRYDLLAVEPDVDAPELWVRRPVNVNRDLVPFADHEVGAPELRRAEKTDAEVDRRARTSLLWAQPKSR